MSLLRAEHVVKKYGGVVALDDVSVTFPEVGITAIIGPNGAGKTTLVNVLSGFARPDSGRCFWGKEELTVLPPHRIAGMGIVRTFQNPRLVRLLTGLDNVILARPGQKGELFFGAMAGDSVTAEESANQTSARVYLRTVGLKHKASELAGQLSYGEQKLLTLACCLATEARVLLLDEPVSGVHPQMATQVLGVLRELRELGRLVVFIEHDLSAVRRVADSVIVMDEGRIIAAGNPRDVLELPEIVEAYVG